MPVTRLILASPILLVKQKLGRWKRAFLTKPWSTYLLRFFFGEHVHGMMNPTHYEQRALSDPWVCHAASSLSLQVSFPFHHRLAGSLPYLFLAASCGDCFRAIHHQYYAASTGRTTRRRHSACVVRLASGFRLLCTPCSLLSRPQNSVGISGLVWAWFWDRQATYLRSWHEQGEIHQP